MLYFTTFANTFVYFFYQFNLKRIFMYCMCFISNFMHFTHVLVLLSARFVPFLIFRSGNGTQNKFCSIGAHYRHIISLFLSCSTLHNFDLRWHLYLLNFYINLTMYFCLDFPDHWCIPDDKY